MSDKRVWVWTETVDGGVHPLSLELLTAARSIGSAEAIVLSPSGAEAVDVCGEYGAAVVHLGDETTYEEFVAEPQVATLINMINVNPPDLILFPSTFSARDVLARLAGTLRLGVIANASSVEYRDGELIATVGYGSAYRAEVTLSNEPPCLVQLRRKSYAAEAVGGSAEVRQAPTLSAAAGRVRVIETVQQAPEGIPLDDAAIIVSGGRGLGQAENFHLVEDLARELNAAVGASRAIVDAGWVPYSYQVGQTGKTVKPGVYIAAGISGAIQHVAGMGNSQHVIAINSDPDAPIFELADLGVVGDALVILPKLTERIRQSK
jgi:electron transfer flavoprotein alpha subunit